MLHFFRASSWSLDEVRKRWYQAVREYAPLYTVDGFHVLVGDGVKQSKEGRRMHPQLGMYPFEYPAP